MRLIHMSLLVSSVDWCCDTLRGELWVKGEVFLFMPRLWGWAQFSVMTAADISMPGKIHHPPRPSLADCLEPRCLSPCLPPSLFPGVTSLLTSSHRPQTVSVTASPWRHMQRQCFNQSCFSTVLSGPILHCRCCDINRKQSSRDTATHSSPPPSPQPATPELYVWRIFSCPAYFSVKWTFKWQKL